MRFDLTRQLRFEFSATNTARIDEPEGIVDRYRDPDRLPALERFGTYKPEKSWAYNPVLPFLKSHLYNLPINKYPFNWVNITARYNATYGWDAGMILPDSFDINLGNVIKNSNTSQLNAQFNMVNLYNKVRLFQRINQKVRQVQARAQANPVSPEFRSCQV
jgi:cell surface protein SprA